jgi:ATP-dependent helicase/nuclease subunit A
LFQALKVATEVHKETPFYMNIDFEGTGEKVLVQGVIDLYFVDKDGDLILVDYKTDHNVDERTLKERYTNQLNMYKIAIEKSTQKKVAQKFIYSTYLNKLVEI